MASFQPCFLSIVKTKKNNYNELKQYIGSSDS